MAMVVYENSDFKKKCAQGTKNMVQGWDSNPVASGDIARKTPFSYFATFENSLLWLL
jgi:hypothetical protein